MSSPLVLSLNIRKTTETNVDITDNDDQCMKACCDAFQIMDNSTPETRYEKRPHVILHVLHLNEIKVRLVQEGKTVVEPQEGKLGSCTTGKTLGEIGVSDAAAVVSCITESLLKHLDAVGCVGKDRVEVVINSQQKTINGFVILKKKDQFPEYDPSEGKIAQLYADVRSAPVVPNTRILIALNDSSPETVGKIRGAFQALFREGPAKQIEMDSF